MHSSCVVWPWLDSWVFHYKCIKCYLNQESIRQWVRDGYVPGEVTFSAVSLNWRGSMAIPSARGLRSLGVSGTFLGLISFVTLERGSWMVNHFRCLAYRVRPNDGVWTVLRGFVWRSEGSARSKLSAYHHRQKSKNPRHCSSRKGRGRGRPLCRWNLSRGNSTRS